MTDLQQHLESIGACPTARDWAGERTPRQAWDEATRADWLLWWAGQLEVEKALLVRCACAIARTVLHLIPAGEDRPRLAIEAAERWCQEPTEENLQEAEEAEEAAWAASAEAAAWAAAAGARAAAAAAWEAARAAQQEHCRIVRDIIPFAEIERRM